MSNLRSRLDRLEKDMNGRPHHKATPWDVLFAAPGSLDPDDPDVRAAIAWWGELLDSVPAEVPDLAETEILKAQTVIEPLPAKGPGANGHLCNGANGQGTGHGRPETPS